MPKGCPLGSQTYVRFGVCWGLGEARGLGGEYTSEGAWALRSQEEAPRPHTFREYAMVAFVLAVPDGWLCDAPRGGPVRDGGAAHYSYGITFSLFTWTLQA